MTFTENLGLIKREPLEHHSRGENNENLDVLDVVAGALIDAVGTIDKTETSSDISLTDSVYAPLKELILYGKSTQEGTPTPTNPVDIISLDCTSATLSVDDTVLTLPNVGAFRGVPVDSGGVYTDANGQQWLCDYIDLIRGVYVQNINNVNVDSTTTVTMQEMPTGSGIYRFNMSRASNPTFLPAKYNVTGVMCNALGVHESPLWVSSNANNNVICAYVGGGLYARYDNATTPAEFIAFAESVGLTVQYILETPIITPLTDEQIEAFKDLYTSDGTTSITNSMGADMKIVYSANLKKHIDELLENLKG